MARVGLNRDKVVALARALVDRGEPLSLAKVADAAGVRTPSLYKHVDGKEAIPAVPEGDDDFVEVTDEVAVAEPAAEEAEAEAKAEAAAEEAPAAEAAAEEEAPAAEAEEAKAE